MWGVRRKNPLVGNKDPPKAAVILRREMLGVGVPLDPKPETLNPKPQTPNRSRFGFGAFLSVGFLWLRKQLPHNSPHSNPSRISSSYAEAPHFFAFFGGLLKVTKSQNKVPLLQCELQCRAPREQNRRMSSPMRRMPRR